MFLLGNVVQRQRQQEVLGTDEEAASLLVQQQGAEAAAALQLEASHAVELLQLCRSEEHGFRSEEHRPHLAVLDDLQHPVGDTFKHSVFASSSFLWSV